MASIMDKIEIFLLELQKFDHTETVYNPYKDENAVNNLRSYLNLLINEVMDIKMLIGEAPGYLGCRITGIPFTSSEQLTNSKHPLISKIKPELKFSNIESENTANFMWDFLSDKPIIPLLWNSFPFHPHHKNAPKTNRAPTADEIIIGQKYLLGLYEIFTPQAIASIGRKGEKALQIAFPNETILYIRHPSYGGKSDFLAGMENFI